MNRRILKKLSKKATPLLAHFEIGGETFLAGRHRSYHGLVIEGNPKDRHRRHAHPLKGTPMVGGMRGYYEPEWEERTALEELMELVMWHERPSSMTDAEWALALDLTGVSPVTLADIEAWQREDDAEEDGPADLAA